MWKMWINPPDVVDGNVVWGDAQRDEATRRTLLAINNRAMMYSEGSAPTPNGHRSLLYLAGINPWPSAIRGSR